MQYARCKCGAVEHWDSGYMLHPCQGCEKCNTTISRFKTGHKELEPHKPKKQFNTNTGEFSHYICAVCYARCTEEGKDVTRTKA